MKRRGFLGAAGALLGTAASTKSTEASGATKSNANMSDRESDELLVDMWGHLTDSKNLKVIKKAHARHRDTFWFAIKRHLADIDGEEPYDEFGNAQTPWTNSELMRQLEDEG